MDTPVAVVTGASSGIGKAIDIDKMAAMVRLKVESSFRLIYTFLKLFKQQDRGHVFITSSVLGTKTREHSGAYAGCNYALEALAESLRMELASTNVQITCLEPGLVQTQLHRDWPVHPSELLNIEHPLAPEDIADAIRDILRKPSHVRIPRYMILPKGHRIENGARSRRGMLLARKDAEHAERREGWGVLILLFPLCLSASFRVLRARTRISRHRAVRVASL